MVGDRRQEIVFIGLNLDEVRPRLEAALDAALVTDEEWKNGPDYLEEEIDDPFGFTEMYAREEVDGDPREVDGHAGGHNHAHTHGADRTHLAKLG